MQGNAEYSILIVDDEEMVREVLTRRLSQEGFDCCQAPNGQEALEVIRARPFDLVITDLKMPVMGGAELLEKIKVLCPDTEVIIMTAYGTIESAVESIKRGAYYYITKPLSTGNVLFHVEKALERKQLTRKVEQLEKEVQGRYKFEGIIGNSNEIVEMLRLVSHVCRTDSTVLIQGESGTGKELVAKAIHYNSRRSDRAYVTVNCGAIPENLQETELFGHVKGAFTGALADKRGLFQEANFGTLFLDEIGDTSPATQVKLLRFLQEGEIRRVGDLKPVQLNVRVLAATNRNLEVLVQDGKFREDLFYRLHVIPIHLPPLRSRREDIPLLARHFQDRFCSRLGRQLQPMSGEALSLLLRYEWPGNIRELENVIERAVILTTRDSISAEDLPYHIQGKKISSFLKQPTRETTLGEMEKNYILEVLERKNWNQKSACKALGISKTTLWRRLKEYGIDPKLLLQSQS